MATRKATISATTPDTDTEFSVTTATGRTLLYRELSVLEEFRLNSILGAEDSTNPTVAFHAMLAMAIRRVDGHPVQPVTNRTSLEQAITTLGRDGFKAVSEHVVAKAQKQSADKELEDAGNSPATPE